MREETDFVDFVRQIFFAPQTKFFVRTQNYIGDRQKLNARLKILRAVFMGQTKIFRVRPEEFKQGFEHRDAYAEILKRHWNYDAFRNFKVYDLQKLDGGIKSTVDVSQEQIKSRSTKLLERVINVS